MSRRVPHRQVRAGRRSPGRGAPALPTTGLVAVLLVALALPACGGGTEDGASGVTASGAAAATGPERSTTGSGEPTAASGEPTAGPGEPTAGPGAAPAGLSASVVQYRRDAQRGVLQVKVRNDGTEPVEVTGVRLDTTTFTGPVEAEKRSRVAAGVAADLTVPLGEPACVATGEAAGPGEHTVTLQVDGADVVLPVTDEVLGPLAAERCAAAAVGEQVALAVSPGWEDAGEVRGEPVLRGEVVATPQAGAASLRLTVEGATTLFTVAEPSAAQLPAGTAATTTLPVLLTVTRCDPHAVAEDKKGYLLPVRVSVDGAEEVLVEVAVPVPERGPLQELVDRTCGFG